MKTLHNYITERFVSSPLFYKQYVIFVPYLRNKIFLDKAGIKNAEREVITTDNGLHLTCYIVEKQYTKKIFETLPDKKISKESLMIFKIPETFNTKEKLLAYLKESNCKNIRVYVKEFSKYIWDNYKNIDDV